MQFQCAFCLILLSLSCHAKDSIESSSKPEQGHKKQLADVKSDPQENVEQINDGVEIVKVTEQWAEKMGLMDLYRTDPGFDKWCILFHEIPGTPPYSFQQKRLLQQLPDRYYNIKGPTSENVIECKNRDTPTGMMVSARGYLPGEKITIRLSGKDAYKEITFFPRPLFMKNEAGKILAKAALLCAKPGQTLYELNICGVDKQRKYKFLSYSGGETLSHNLQGPIESTIMPEVIGQVRGIAKIVLDFENGTRYSMKLPWGIELLDYTLGNK